MALKIVIYYTLLAVYNPSSNNYIYNSSKTLYIVTEFTDSWFCLFMNYYEEYNGWHFKGFKARIKICCIS